MIVGEGWQVVFIETDMLRRYLRVAIYRRSGDRTSVVCNDGTIRETSEDVEFDKALLPLMPVSALGSLRDAIDERMGRRVDEKQLEEVRSSLQIERARLDRVLGAFLEAK